MAAQEKKMVDIELEQGPKLSTDKEISTILTGF
jgi:hypothetical protein